MTVSFVAEEKNKAKVNTSSSHVIHGGRFLISIQPPFLYILTRAGRGENMVFKREQDG
jgi:hypothetical protein